MSGFIGVVQEGILEKNISLNIRTNNERSIKRVANYSDAIFLCQKHLYFDNDYIFCESDDYIVCFWGILINSRELLSAYKVSCIQELVTKVLVADDFINLNKFCGNYAGFCYWKKIKKIKIFSNHFSQRPVYYYLNKNKDIFIFSSHIESIVDVLKQSNLKVNYSELGVYYMLTFGYMLREQTIVEGIYKVLPATVITVDAEMKMTANEYYQYNNVNIHSLSEGELMENFFQKLEHACQLGFDKDVEYGRDTLITLSGGLDSRLIAFAAKNNGKDNVSVFTFGQTGCDDVCIAGKIANFLKDKLIFVSLDGGKFIRDIDAVLNRNFGGVQYISSIHSLYAAKELNYDKYGLMHNGNVADISHGDYLSLPYHTSPSPRNWANSSRLFFRIDKEIEDVASYYANDEHFSIYNRGINGILNGGGINLDFIDSYEPYMYPELVDFASKISPQYKFNERLFLLLIEKYYSEAAAFKWQRWDMRPTVKNLTARMQFFIKAKRKIRKIVGNYRSNMNPFQKWMMEDDGLRQYWDNIFKENIVLFQNNTTLLQDMKQLYINGNISEKSQVITVLKIQERLLK